MASEDINFNLNIMTTKNKYSISIRLKRSIVKKFFPKNYAFLFCNGKYQCFEDGDDFSKKNILTQKGWLKSLTTQRPIDENEEPTLWYTYSSIFFLEKKLKKDFDVFEYGAGNSTLYYTKHCNSVTSVEDDKDWFSYIKESMPPNAQIALETDYSKYVSYIKSHKKKYDIIVIDGSHRLKCAKFCTSFLKERGVIIYDNSDFEEFKEGALLLDKGFKRLDFYGHVPCNAYCHVTTIFYKKDNIFNI